VCRRQEPSGYQHLNNSHDISHGERPGARPICYTNRAFLQKPQLKNGRKTRPFEKFCQSGKEEARTVWSNVDKGPQKVGHKPYGLDQSYVRQHNTLR